MICYVAWNTPMALAIYKNIEKYMPGQTTYITNLDIIEKFCKENNLPYYHVYSDKEEIELIHDLKPSVSVSHCFLNGLMYGKRIQLFHGLVEKMWTYCHPLLKDWDYIVAPGDLAKDKLQHYLGISDKKIRVIGYPKLDDIQQRKPYGDTPNLLYCPTHGEYSSEGVMLEPLLKLKESYPNIVVKLHDATKLRNEYQMHFQVSDGYNNIDEINKADLIISDCSSTIIEANYSGKPIIQIDMPGHQVLINNRQFEMVHRNELGMRISHQELDKLPQLVREALSKNVVRNDELLNYIVKNKPSGAIVAQFLQEIHDKGE